MMKLLTIWALPLVALLAILLLSVMTGSFALGSPLLFLLVWLGYALFKSRSRMGVAITGGTVVIVGILIVWALRTPGLVESFFVGRISAEIQAQTSGTAWREKTVSSFRLRYQDNDPGATKVASVLAEAHARVAGFFPELPGKTIVVVYPSLKNLEKAVKSDLPDYGIGGAFGTMMAVTSPDTWSVETLTGTTIEQVVAHEFSHVVVNQLGKNRVTKWLNEGIATSVAGQFTPSIRDRLIKESIKGKLYSLTEVDRYFHHPAAQPDKDGGLMYAVAASVVTYVIETYGAERLVDMLRVIGGGKTTDLAIQSVLGLDQAALESAWLKGLQSEVWRHSKPGYEGM